MTRRSLLVPDLSSIFGFALPSLACVDTSGHWGRGGMFDALSKLSMSIGDAYERASEHGDLHLGDLHLIRLDDGCDEHNVNGNAASKMVALAVVQSYNPRRKIPRSGISLLHLESCLSKASFSAAQNFASIHMPRIGYQDGSDRSEWYTIERLLKKYASIYNINIYVKNDQHNSKQWATITQNCQNHEGHLDGPVAEHH
ncbi:hypothetical protein Fmac_011338 [Flemingia macrophylla]|uniref:Macro domain-containing protein n=1 Tax=Flemingia macrophylla TaxID=520843 RepID=A0ABD1MM70_9FABA